MVDIHRCDNIRQVEILKIKDFFFIYNCKLKLTTTIIESCTHFLDLVCCHSQHLSTTSVLTSSFVMFIMFVMFIILFISVETSVTLISDSLSAVVETMSPSATVSTAMVKVTVRGRFLTSIPIELPTAIVSPIFT